MNMYIVYAYEVGILESNRKFIFQNALLSPIPNTLNIASNGTKYVTVRSTFSTSS